MGCIGVNKMDCDTAAYKQGRYDEIANEMKSMLVKVGWEKDFIEKNTPVLPISGWMGDNLLKKSDNMAWWKGQDIEYGKETIHVDTVYDVLDKLCRVPERPISAPMRMPISAAIGRCYGLQEGHHLGTDARVRRSDSGARHPQRDQGRLLSDRLCALWPLRLPHLCAQVEDGQRDRW